MSDWKCAICPYVASSMADIKFHCLQEHNSYANPPRPETKDLSIDTIESFRTTKAEVQWLLTTKPETRGNDNLLMLEHLKYFQKMFIYTPESQKITFRDPNGVTYQQFIYMRCWETIRRCRQKLQEQDRKLFHTEDGESKKEHLCLLPSERVQLKRERREAVLHSNMKYL